MVSRCNRDALISLFLLYKRYGGHGGGVNTSAACCSLSLFANQPLATEQCS